MDKGFWKEVVLTQGGQVPVVLYHHVPVQFPLTRVQAFPLLLSEVYGHILECQPSLKYKVHMPYGCGRLPYVTQDETSKRNGFDSGEYLVLHKNKIFHTNILYHISNPRKKEDGVRFTKPL